jgi:hypothetical protein
MESTVASTAVAVIARVCHCMSDIWLTYESCRLGQGKGDPAGNSRAGTGHTRFGPRFYQPCDGPRGTAMSTCERMASPSMLMTTTCAVVFASLPSMMLKDVELLDC